MRLVTIDRDRPLIGAEPSSLELDSRIRPDATPREVYRWARWNGWSEGEAGDWAAWVAGIQPFAGEELPDAPWTLRSIEHLLWLRWLVASGRLET